MLKIKFIKKRYFIDVTKIESNENEQSFIYSLIFDFQKNTKKELDGNKIIEIFESEFDDILKLVKNKNLEIENIDFLNKTNWNKTKEKIIINKNKNFDEHMKNEDFKKFVKLIIQKLNVDIDGEFENITKKQILNIYSMIELENVLNFSEPGTGKTLMTLMWLASKLKKDQKVIIISPKNSMNVWYEEIKYFWKEKNKIIHFFNEDFHKYYSDQPKNLIHDIDYADFILINYESVQKISKNQTLKKILNFYGYHVVMDEAHRIKNGKKIRNLLSKNASKNAKSRTILTGTPFSTTIEEIFEMIRLSWPISNPFISESKFEYFKEKINVSNIEDNFSKIKITEDTKQAIKEFSNALNPLYFSLKKKKDFKIKDAIDSFKNPIQTEPLKIQIEIDQRYSKLISDLSHKLENEKDFKIRTEINEQLSMAYTSAQQNAINPFLLENRNFLKDIFSKHDFIEFEKLPKIKAALKFVKEKISNGERVLVWFTFVDNIIKFNNLLKKEGINSEIIYGNTPIQERKKIIDDISKDDSSIQVLISNPATIAESISLHKTIMTSLFVERTFSYFRWAQAKDRIHRVGSKGKVTHDYIFTKNLSIEEKIFSNLNKKDEISKKIFDSNDLYESLVKQNELYIEEKNDENCYGDQYEKIYN